MRKIIHIDMDAFYASVELKKYPHLVQAPVVIASSHPRAVITAASYPARAFGLRSAMSVHQARQLCPQLIILPPHFDEYRQISAQLQQIFQHYTDLIEPIALDEAYLDVTENKMGFASATELAIHLRHTIWQQLELTASAGVAPNKFLAKIASDWQKPNGLFVIKPTQVQQFIRHLALTKIPGVGRVTAQKLTQLGLNNLGDLQNLPESVLVQHFGKYGRQLFLYAQGIDERPVVADRERQQISKETTFDQDHHLWQCHHVWQALLQQVWQIAQHKKLQARGLSIKLKFHNFQIKQHSKTYTTAFQNLQQLQIALEHLLQDVKDSTEIRLRLIGVSLYQLSAEQADQQLSLLD